MSRWNCLDTHSKRNRSESERYDSKCRHKSSPKRSIDCLIFVSIPRQTLRWSLMSWFMMNTTPEEYHPKYSFDRFGDDLCEEFLSYLPFEDSFLKTIDVRFVDGNNPSRIGRILAEYGSQLTAIQIPLTRLDVWRDHCRSLTRLRRLSGHNSMSLLFNDSHELMVTTLTDTSLYYYGYRDGHSLPLFVDHYRNRLKSLELQMIKADTPEEYIHVMTCLPQLQALRELTLHFGVNTEGNIQSIVDYHCKEFVYKWPQLRTYRLHMKFETFAQLRQLYESVNRMKCLRELDLRLSLRDVMAGNTVLFTLQYEG
ncbi:unnamed protein product [Oppiella nova]|uniref:Uncharacterized protein n=1 Tax=Oppiella nova TaxID=334625 RepID=A0A7R9QDT1_9ACAR|nr:unnamed protein product [Oppiella nova]CAG2163008.1 unnamed protein product [Oppiella nova]